MRKWSDPIGPLEIFVGLFAGHLVDHFRAGIPLAVFLLWRSFPAKNNLRSHRGVGEVMSLVKTLK